MNDRVLAGRFRLTHLLGRGGMAEVWAAHDEQLDRDVAIKILLPRFASDQGFQERFIEEGRRAARLNHPNVVTVLDTGLDEPTGLRYIVMELIQGRSLQEVIAHGGLTEDRGLEVVADVCAALHHAHDQGLVHRDVKPGNILLSESGMVKVTDFGIARAIDSDSNVTQTAQVLGTAAYLSPEQAQGRPVDARSDVYSLGVVLYEVLTGEQPFQGETAVTVAYQHVQENPRPPRDLISSLSPAAEAICVRAMAKNPVNRYATAMDFREDILNALHGQGVAAPAVLRPEDTALLDPVGARGPVPERQRRRRQVLGYIALGLASLLAAALAVFLLLSNLGDDGAGRREVPDVVGRTLEQAQTLLRNKGLTPLVLDEVYSDEWERGRVARQDPSAGTGVDDGTTVGLYLSRGPRQVAVPEVEGMSEEDATAALSKAGLRVGERQTRASDTVERGIVLEATPAPGVLVAEGTRVDLVISAGEELIRVRQVQFLSEGDAKLSLSDQGFEVLVVREFSDFVDEGVVIRQEPEAGAELARGSEVTIVVSNGPENAEPSETEPAPTETEPPPSESPSPSDSPSPSPSETAVP